MVEKLGGVGIVTGIAALLARSIVSMWLSKNVERYRAALKDENARAIEGLRHALGMQALEHEVRFRNMHEVQAKVIAEVYQCLYDLHLKVRQYVSPIDYAHEPDKDGKLALVAKSDEHFKNLFYPRGLFFPEDVAKRIDDFHLRLYNIVDEFSEGRRKQKEGTNTMYWSAAWESIERI